MNYLAKRGWLQAGSTLFGKAFENFLFHELNCEIEYHYRDLPISYWSLTTTTEVDFVIGDLDCVIEVKSSQNTRPHHLKGLREIKKEYPKVGKRVLVCLETEVRKTEDGIDILPLEVFLEQLWSQALF